ncbi:riboflavin synthase [Ornithinibacillus californiensis]|uniref:riboflavin synthase n=1 Tax=Ornithinibacillus californiensis TaxID=161536 RepID=UPI00064D857A|nr:riboflavin synthase [Ornithinibacillus californiensis]
MFTGIIEEMGTIKGIQKRSEHAIQMIIESKKILDDVKLGDSIAVNGVCLTVTSFTMNDFQVDVMPETVKSTSLKDLINGSKVNLERAMPANGRFGGHFVSGHVDGIGEIIRKQRQENAIYYDIKVSDDLKKYLMLKGSITVDGTSLTIFNVNKNIVTISIIPHTVQETIVGDKSQGDIVNIECDMLAKYVHNILNPTNQTQKADIDKELLIQNGFM